MGKVIPDRRPKKVPCCVKVYLADGSHYDTNVASAAEAMGFVQAVAKEGLKVGEEGGIMTIIPAHAIQHIKVVPIL